MALEPGFDLAEAETLIAFSTYFYTYPEKDVKPTPPEPPYQKIPIPGPRPAGWTCGEPHIHEGNFNAFRICTHDESGRLAVVFRGTVDEKGSTREDLDIKAVSAEGFSSDPKARIEHGLREGFLSIADALKAQLKAKLGDAEGPVDCYITGHSQGASMSILCGAWLVHSVPELAKRLRIKTYLFASPKTGNDYFVYDYDFHQTNSGMCFRITNTLDFIPQGPLTIQLPGDEAERRLDLPIPKILKFLLEIRLPHTRNFVASGAPIILRGIPAPDAFPDDAFFQHHAGRYWVLLLQKRHLPEGT